MVGVGGYMTNVNSCSSYQTEIMESAKLQRQTACFQILALPLTRYVASYANYFIIMIPAIPFCKVGKLMAIVVLIS